jgi:plastocyanin
VVAYPSGISGAVIAMDESAKKNTIQIKGMAFSPEYLRVEESAIVEWILPITGKIDTSIKHVVCFDDLPVESDCLKMIDGQNVFREQFDRVGVYDYKCLIYTRMKGRIEVVKRGSKQGGTSSAPSIVSSLKDAQRKLK